MPTDRKYDKRGDLRRPHAGPVQLSYTDAKLSLTKEWAGLALGAAIVGTDADETYYQVANAGGADPKRIGTTTLVLSVGKTF
jgi:hypothetical protein